MSRFLFVGSLTTKTNDASYLEEKIKTMITSQPNIKFERTLDFKSRDTLYYFDRNTCSANLNLKLTTPVPYPSEEGSVLTFEERQLNLRTIMKDHNRLSSYLSNLPASKFIELVKKYGFDTIYVTSDRLYFLLVAYLGEKLDCNVIRINSGAPENLSASGKFVMEMSNRTKKA